MFDNFLKEKSDFLKKKDKSKKGHIDKGIVKILNKINSKKDYYTTSSCAGRIVLLEMKSKKKNECAWIFNKHDKAGLNEIINSLKKYQNKKIINNKKTLKYMGEAKLNGRKNFAEHKLLSRSDGLNDNFKASQIKNQIYFKQQPLILHVACRNTEAANKLLNLSRKIFKHSGIISISGRKVMVEIIGNERIETIIADKNFIIDENYLKNLIKYANENFVENKIKSEGFFKIVEKI